MRHLPANRLVSVDGGATAQYRYDHQNQGVTKIVGSSWTHYLWEGGQVIGEHDGTAAYSTNPPCQAKSARLDYIYARGKMIYTRERTSDTAPWMARYYVSDVWSTRLVLDASGSVLGRQGHLAFGEEFAESGTQEKHHFTSYESESQTATDYAVNRQYSQSVGRFGSADPYETSSYLVNPQSWNRYSYVENDPIHNVDRLGLLIAAPGPEPDPCCTSCSSGDPLAPTQPVIRCPPSADDLLNSREFIDALEAAWNDSKASSPTDRHEEGGWVYWDPKLGILDIIRAPAGAGAMINLSFPPDRRVLRWALVAVFHTHPNPPIDESGAGWRQGPSAQDELHAAQRGVPSFIRAWDGIHAYGYYRRGANIDRQPNGTFRFRGPWLYPGPWVPQVPGC